MNYEKRDTLFVNKLAENLKKKKRKKAEEQEKDKSVDQQQKKKLKKEIIKYGLSNHPFINHRNLNNVGVQ